GVLLAPPDDGALDLDCLVIDDANFGFRNQPGAWPACLQRASAPRQVVLKLANPIAHGPLWERLASELGERLTVYCALGDLRKEYAPIGQPLSWERSASDAVKAVRARTDLRAAARIIVGLGLSGAVVIERDGPATLIYDPLHQEGDWEHQR